MLFDNVFGFELSKPLNVGNYILNVSAFTFNTVTEEGQPAKYNFHIEGKTTCGRDWNDRIYPNVINKGQSNETNGFALFLKSVQRQLAPDADWTPPKTKAKLTEWITMITDTIEGSSLAVSVVQYSTPTKSGFNKQYYQVTKNDKALSF